MEQMSSQGLNTDIRARISEEQRRRVDALVAYRSARGDDDDTASDVFRDALEEYLDENRPPEAFLDAVEDD
jgi:hypothetical protein